MTPAKPERLTEGKPILAYSSNLQIVNSVVIQMLRFEKPTIKQIALINIDIRIQELLKLHNTRTVQHIYMLCMCNTTRALAASLSNLPDNLIDRISINALDAISRESHGYQIHFDVYS